MFPLPAQVRLAQEQLGGLVWGGLTFVWMLAESALRTLKSRKRAEKWVCGPWIRTELLIPEDT